MTAALLWLAVAFTPVGPIVGEFATLEHCRVAVAYARMQDYVSGATDCLPVTPGMVSK